MNLTIPDYPSFVSKRVFVRIKRRGKYHEKTGVFTGATKHYISLRNGKGKTVWMPRPDYYRDFIKELI